DGTASPCRKSLEGNRQPAETATSRTDDAPQHVSCVDRRAPPAYIRDVVEQAWILGTIGGTPLVQLRRIVRASGAEIWVKLEYPHPTGSMKDRMGLSMIEGGERDGLIEPGTTVVEYTGGSTGPALAIMR